MRDMQQLRWEEMLGRIDRRLVYLGLFLVTLAPLVFRWSLPLYTSPPAALLQQTIEGLRPDKVVFISSNWDAGTQAENRPQLVAIVRHLIRKKIRFVVFSIGSPTAPQLAQGAVEEAIELEKAGGTWRYGTEWANLGFKAANAPWFRSFTRQVTDAYKTDWTGTPVEELAVMQGVRKFGPPEDPNSQIQMMIDITASATIDYWFQYLSPYKMKMGLACTAVMAPEQYPYLDSGQLHGLLTGMKGAAEYEQLVGAPGLGLPAMAGQSFAHLYIFILILLGNLSVLLSWRRRRA